MNFAKLSFYIVAICLLLDIPAHAQSRIATMFNENSQFVGIQFNPYINSLDRLWQTSYYPGKSKIKVYAIRYGIEVPKNLFLAVDLSFYNSKNKANSEYYFEFKPGILGRYIFFSKKNVSIITELGGYYRFISFDFPGINNYPPDVIEELKKPKPGWFTSAGMGINLYKKKVTLDLMVKYSPDIWFEGYHFAPTYKLNYHFK
jgi:hypothetical protein